MVVAGELSLTDRIGMLPKEILLHIIVMLNVIKRAAADKCSFCGAAELSYAPVVECGGCAMMACEACLVDQFRECEDCDVPFCQECILECAGCGHATCDGCARNNADIGYDVLCQHCQEEEMPESDGDDWQP